MSVKSAPKKFDKRAVRNWTLYVIRLSDGHYYVGITSRSDFMRRIRQHGGRTGARVNRGKKVEEIVEIQQLGKMSALRAQTIENDVTLDYRKRFGARKVRGGYNVSKSTFLIPNYTPGSKQATIFILLCLAIAVCLLIVIVARA